MSPATLFRVGGLALLVALPLQVLGFVLHPPSEEVHHVLTPLYGPAHLILLGSWLLVMLALPGMYARQATRAGMLGLAGFIATMLAVSYHIYLLVYESFATTTLAREAPALIGDGPLAHGANAFGPAAVALVFVAFPLFGIATVRARIFPRWSGWLQVASVPVFALGAVIVGEASLPGLSALTISYYVLFIGYAWAGYVLWSEREPAGTVPALAEPPAAAAST